MRRCARRARCRRESLMASDSSSRASLAIPVGYHDGRWTGLVIESSMDHAAPGLRLSPNVSLSCGA